MGQNSNPHVIDLLSWHGHAKGGVHVPFQRSRNPLGQTIQTRLMVRLRKLAMEIASSSTSSPRWVFLIGGPGNGKSETVQDFLSHLDAALGLNGSLSNELSIRYNRDGIIPRKIEITPIDLDSSRNGIFSSNIGRLVIIQDATATESALGDASRELAHDIADLLTLQNSAPIPVFVACANRGILARAMTIAFTEYGIESEVVKIIAKLIQASSLGRETLIGRKSCWPLESDKRFACWPLDIESLLIDDGTNPGELEQIIQHAVERTRWEIPSRCEDCNSKSLCPIRNNAELLRDDATRKNLSVILRHGELMRGQRWNFRDGLSLISELLVGQWSDYDDFTDPCKWVHRNVDNAKSSTPSLEAIVSLTMRLYPHALFRGGHIREAALEFIESGKVDQAKQPISYALLRSIIASSMNSSTKPIREILSRDYSRLDPATVTPNELNHPLRLIEEDFCQSVDQGRHAAQVFIKSPLESKFLDIFIKAEREWKIHDRDSVIADIAVCLLRKLAAMMTKRAIGTRLGRHALDLMIADYAACIRDSNKLTAVRSSLLTLLGQQKFEFNLIELLGQPTADIQPVVGLIGQAPGASLKPAPNGNETTPSHDVPCVQISGIEYLIPLTFDFYLALRLRKAGCTGSSLPASVRAAIDRIRHRYAGDLCRNQRNFLEGTATISVGATKKIEISSAGSDPILVDK